jgi:hypothetical protein
MENRISNLINFLPPSSTTLLRNQAGFAMAIMTALLPVLLGAFLMTFSLIKIIQVDQKLKHICRFGGVKGQAQVAPNLKALLALNPLALKLQFELKQAKAQAAKGNAAAVAYLVQVEARVLAFKIKQQQLIRQSNILLYTNHLTTQFELKKEKYDIQNAFPLFEGSYRVQLGSSPNLAVVPDSSESPPTYSTKEDFKTQQALAHNWQYDFSVSKKWQPFLTGNFYFQKSCTVTLKNEATQWVPQIIKVK